VVEELPQMKDAFSKRIEDLTSVEKKVLVERHLISREHADNSHGSSIIVERQQGISIMINEEDHLRMQAIVSGLELLPAYEMLNAVDSALEEKLDFAFDNRLGYLTSCPTNLGTGMRASVMVHLPGLVMSDQINRVITAVNKIGLAVRGYFGEGSEAQSNLFQVSNQTTLGEPEHEIIKRINRVIEQILTHENNARRKLIEDKPHALCDQIGRAYAALRNAWMMDSKEALNYLSMLRLGMDLGCISEKKRDSLDLLILEIQPSHLQLRAKNKISPEQRDILRAEILRARLQSIPEPDMRPLWDASADAIGDQSATRQNDE
jgi:protein arginine kinase